MIKIFKKSALVMSLFIGVLLYSQKTISVIMNPETVVVDSNNEGFGIYQMAISNEDLVAEDIENLPLLLEVTLENAEPLDTTNVIESMTGPYVDRFSWEWDSALSKLTGTQISPLDLATEEIIDIFGTPVTFRNSTKGEIDINLRVSGEAGVDKVGTSPVLTYRGVESIENNDFTTIVQSSSDNDGDGIVNDIDLDNDNDGVLDSIECELTTLIFDWNSAGFTDANISSTSGHTVDLGVATGLSYLDGITMNAKFTTSNSSGNPSTLVWGFNSLAIANTPGATQRIEVTFSEQLPYTTVQALYDPTFINGEFITFSSGGALSSPTTALSGDSLTDKSLTNPAVNGGGPSSYSSRPVFDMMAEETSLIAIIGEESGGQNSGSQNGFILQFSTRATCDTDGDGIANINDLDSDGDGCPDSVEAGVRSATGNPVFEDGVVINGDGTTNTLSLISGAVVSGAYGDNGFADTLESSEDGSFTGSYTYSKAIDADINGCTCTKSGASGGDISTSKVGVSTLDRSKVIDSSREWPKNINNGALVLESLNKGLVLTRMSDPDRAIGSPIKGMLVYDTDDMCLKLYDGSKWGCLVQSCPDYHQN